MRALALISAAVIAVATGAQAQSSWVYVTDGTGHITGLNNRSRTNAGTHKRAWFVRILAKTELDYDYALMHYEMDCSGNRMRRVSAAAYKMDGTSSFTLPSAEPWEPIFPESIAEAMLMEVCQPSLLDEPGFESAKAFAEWGRSSLLND